jgi:methyl-accepting chemotaxis protein
MLKKLKNMKIISGVLMLVIIASLSMAAIEAFGISTSRKINNNLIDVYKNNLVPIAKLGDIRADFLSIRVVVNKSFIEYSENQNTKVIQNYERINETVKSIEVIGLNSQETKQLNDFKTYIARYMETWNQSKVILSKGGKLNDQQYESFTQIGESIEKILIDLSKYNVQEAEKVSDNSNKIYASSFKMVLIIFTAVLCIFANASIFIIRMIKNSSKEMINTLNIVAKGDFTVDIDTESTNEFGIMKKSLNTMITDIKSMISTIKDKSIDIESRAENLGATSEEMTAACENVSATVQESASGTSVQAQDLVTITTTLNEFGEQIEKVACSIKEVYTNANQVGIMASDSNANMIKLVDSIKNVENSSSNLDVKITNLEANINRINEITNLINSISDQTNLLALNAAIEAARAGESGRGFAVVADEIRKLAVQSKSSSASISSLLNDISKDTSSMVYTSGEVKNELDRQAGTVKLATESFKDIINAVHTVIPMIEEINESIEGVQSEKNEIIDKIEGASAIAEEIAASAEEISASTEELNASSEEVSNTALELSYMTKDMFNEIDKFKL